MSTEFNFKDLDKRCRQAGYRYHVPEDTRDEYKRTILVSQEVQSLLDISDDDHEHLIGSAETGVVFDRFVQGGLFGIALNPDLPKKNALWSKVAPASKGIVCTRVIGAKPQVRVLGGFLNVDLFVALSWHDRDGLIFAPAIERANNRLKTNFPGFKLINGKSHKNYVSENGRTVEQQKRR